MLVTLHFLFFTLSTFLLFLVLFIKYTHTPEQTANAHTSLVMTTQGKRKHGPVFRWQGQTLWSGDQCLPTHIYTTVQCSQLNVTSPHLTNQKANWVSSSSNNSSVIDCTVILADIQTDACLIPFCAPIHSRLI